MLLLFCVYAIIYFFNFNFYQINNKLTDCLYECLYAVVTAGRFDWDNVEILDEEIHFNKRHIKKTIL